MKSIMMVKFQRLFITGVILLGFSFSVCADEILVQEPGGRVRIPLSINENGIRTWQYLDNKGNMFHHDYVAEYDKSLKVRHASSGMLSNSTVPVKIESKVPRKTVWANLFKNAKAGGKAAASLGARYAGWFGLAYSLVDVALTLKGWSYDAEKGNWVKPVQDNQFMVIKTKTASGWPLLENFRKYDMAGISKLCENKDGCELMGVYDSSSLNAGRISVCRTTTIKRNNETYEADSVFTGGRCARVFDGRYTYVNEYYAIAVRYSEKAELSQHQFDEIIQPYSDANPSEYVDKSRPSETSPVPGVSVDENVTVPDGTVVTIGPYTDTDGQPKQVTVRFTTANGQTTATVTVTSRPDLTPNSPSAPSSSSGSSSNPGSSSSPGSSSNPANAPNPDGSSETGGDTRTENIPKKDTDSNDEPSDNPDEKTDDKPKEQQDGGLLCELFPDILACAKMGEVAEDEPFKIPHITNETAFSPDFFLPDTGTCPAPETVSIMGQQYSFTYEWLCRFAEMIRFIVIGIASISAAYIMFSGLRKD